MVASDEYSTVISAGGPRAYEVPWHSHDCLMLMLPHAGAIDFRDEVGRAGSWISEDRFVAVPKGHTHTGRSNNAPHMLLYVTDASLKRVSAEAGSLSNLRKRMRVPSSFAVTPQIRALRDLCRRGAAEQTMCSSGMDHLVSALLLMLFAQIDRSNPLPSGDGRNHGEAVVREICSFIESHTSTSLPLDCLAETFGLSRRHATRLFRERTGLSIAQYHERTRIVAATDLLTGTSLPVSEIALRVGFESGSALARAIRRVLDCSPSMIRSAGGIEVARLRTAGRAASLV